MTSLEVSGADPLFPVQDRGRWGYIDATGAIRIELDFDEAEAFSEGAAAVRRGELWGYIDDRGRWAIRPRYTRAGPFSEGRAAVETPEGERLQIDARGTVRGLRDWRWIGPLREDRAAVKNDGGRWGFVDGSGAVVIGFDFDDVSDFSEGLAAVQIGHLWGAIDRSGRIVVEPTLDELAPHSEGLMAASRGGAWGFLDVTGAWAIEPCFQMADSFAEGLAPVRVGERWGYVDPRGEFTIPPQFDLTLGFSQGLAAVELYDRWGYIDRTGHMVVERRYDGADEFAGGLAYVEKRRLGGYIDRTGAPIWTRPTKSRWTMGLLWDPPVGDLAEALAEVLDPRIVLEGTWVKSSVLEGASLTIESLGAGRFRVAMESSGCLGSVSSTTEGTLVAGVLRLDEPVEEYGPGPYEILYTVRIDGIAFLLPAEDLPGGVSYHLFERPLE